MDLDSKTQMKPKGPRNNHPPMKGEKGASHYAAYHAPSTEMYKSGCKGGKQSDQHTSTKNISYFKPSK